MEAAIGSLFNSETTYRTYYKKNKIEQEPPKTVYVPKPKKPKPDCSIVDYSPKYVQTMTKWKNCIAPFNLYIRPDPVRCDPNIKQEHYERLGDPDREEAQKTRPRLVMTPAASLDDIDDPEMRSVIVSDMYLSSLDVAQTTAAMTAFPVDKNVKAPLPDKYAPPKPIFLPRKRQPYVSPEWRMESMFWERRQARGFADSTAEFWRGKK